MGCLVDLFCFIIFCQKHGSFVRINSNLQFFEKGDTCLWELGFIVAFVEHCAERCSLKLSLSPRQNIEISPTKMATFCNSSGRQLASYYFFHAVWYEGQEAFRASHPLQSYSWFFLSVDNIVIGLISRYHSIKRAVNLSVTSCQVNGDKLTSSSLYHFPTHFERCVKFRLIILFFS